VLRVVSAEIIHGDCLEVMRGMADASVDAIVTDPPYGVLLGRRGRNQKSLPVQAYAGYEDTPENLARLIREAMPEFLRIARRIVITPGVRNLWRWPQPDHIGAFYYPSATGCNSWGFSCWQPILYYGKDPYLQRGMGSRPDSTQSTEKAERNGHPCPKPLGQMLWLVQRVTLPGETILDPFSGSGTTGVAAMQTGRRFIGIEREDTYVELARKRLADVQPELAA
jgi:site-specific DNA-methyltransferase (adenine-specific)